MPDWPDGLEIHGAYNEVIHRCAAQRTNVHLVPLHRAFLGHGSHCRQFWRDTYCAEDPHSWYYVNIEDPNDRGYDAIRRVFLNTILERSALRRMPARIKYDSMIEMDAFLRLVARMGNKDIAYDSNEVAGITFDVKDYPFEGISWREGLDAVLADHGLEAQQDMANTNLLHVVRKPQDGTDADLATKRIQQALQDGPWDLDVSKLTKLSENPNEFLRRMSGKVDVHTIPPPPNVADVFIYSIIVTRQGQRFWIHRTGGFAGVNELYGIGILQSDGTIKYVGTTGKPEGSL